MDSPHSSLRAIAAGALVLGLLAASPVEGAPQAIALPADYSDFALHPETGDLAALHAEKGEAVLFRRADLDAGRAEPAASVRVGATPCAVVYKQFQDKHIFAVVCSQDSHMFVVDAGNFELLEKIELEGAGVSNVAASQNPEDPFLYYNFGSGHDSAAGAVSLRDMRSHGPAFDRAMDCAFSASGEVAYRRGPWSPSGFESLIRTSDIGDEKPTFARLFYDHKSTAAYVPDPFDRFTAAGNLVFTRALDKQVAGLDFAPQCFFRTRPVVIGHPLTHAVFRGREQAGTLTLQAASYNTFSPIGDRVLLKQPASDAPADLPRGVPSQADFKRVAKRSRVFADDGRDRVVYAERNHAFLVPLEDFNLPEEAFLLATLEGPRKAIMGRENRFTLARMDDRAEIVVEDKPEGMKAEGETLIWTPSPEQIGPATLAVTFKHADLQRTLTYDLEVAYPHSPLPFVAADFAVDAEGKRAVIWEGAASDTFGRPAQPGPAASSIRLAVVEIATGKVLAERKLAEHIGSGQVAGEHLILLPRGASPRCDVLRLDTLERVKALTARAPIQRADVMGDLLILQTQSSVEAYDRNSLAPVRIFENAGVRPGAGPQSVSVTQHGVFVHGVLYDVDLQPKLIVAPGDIPSLGGGAAGGAIPSFLQATPQLAGNRPVHSIPSRDGVSRLATVQLPDMNVNVAADLRTQQVQIPGAVHTWRTVVELSLTASGAADARQVLVRKFHHAQTAGAAPVRSPVLKAGPGAALLAYEDKLYRWPIPVPADDESSPRPLTWIPRQSALTIDGDGKTVLEHEVKGGKPPVQFAMLTPYESMSIDESTGVVTVDEAPLAAEAMKAMENFLASRGRGESLVDTLRAQAPAMIERTLQILGRRPHGAPVAIPVRVDASDANLESAPLQYFLIAEIPSEELLERLRELDQERNRKLKEAQAAAAAAAQQAPAGAPEEAGVRRELAAMRQRMDALEQRLDLVTRQLNAVLEKLEKEN